MRLLLAVFCVREELKRNVCKFGWIMAKCNYGVAGALYWQIAFYRSGKAEGRANFQLSKILPLNAFFFNIPQ